jgi:hypothetical protein
MPQQTGEFGRRSGSRPPSGVVAVASSPLTRQVGGILFGVAIAFAIGAGFILTMKYAGRLLDNKFVESATPGAPQEAIKQIKNADSGLKAIQETCTQRAKEAKLTPAQSRATDGYMELYAGESEMTEAAAFVECLATSKPSRFCQAPDKKHLIEATRQYAKLNLQMAQAWWMAMGGPGGANKASLTGAPYTAQQREALRMPSVIMSPTMVAALRSLVQDGWVSAKDLAALTGNGVPPQFKETLANIQPKKGACG